MILRTPEDIGLLVRDRRMALGWSQAALAARIDSGRQWVVDLERGNPGAELGRVLRALSALGVLVDLRPTTPPATTVPAAANFLRQTRNTPTHPGAWTTPSDGGPPSIALDVLLGERSAEPPRPASDSPSLPGPASGGSPDTLEAPDSAERGHRATIAGVGPRPSRGQRAR